MLKVAALGRVEAPHARVCELIGLPGICQQAVLSLVFEKGCHSGAYPSLVSQNQPCPRCQWRPDFLSRFVLTRLALPLEVVEPLLDGGDRELLMVALH
jgi:hypothetical protein